jgi:hypothetical protein
MSNDDGAELLQHLASSIVDKAWDEFKSLAAKSIHTLRDNFGNAYSDYLSSAGQKMFIAKSFFYRNPVPLPEFYVPLHLLKDERDIIRNADRTKLRDAAAIYHFTHEEGRKIVQEGNFIIITGMAAQGKSTLVQHLFVDCLRGGQSIPVLIRLRDLNQEPRPLLEQIHASLAAFKFDKDIDFVRNSLEQGAFTVFLDGLDEVHPTGRAAIKTAILALADRYPKNMFVIASRPDFEFDSWHRFVRFTVLPLDEGQAVELVTKLRAEEETKSKFIAGLKASLFREHQSFLSNPLLLTIMLLTYREIAEIPEKRHLFYHEAFTALFNRHDAQKGYQRITHTRLPIDDFERVLGHFAIDSYLNALLSFTDRQLVECLGRAKEYTGITFSVEAFREDLRESLSFLVREGNLLTYTHRQFQEYFAARHISLQTESLQREWIATLTPDMRPNEVVRMLWEMNAEVVESLYILPRLQQVLADVRQAVLGEKEEDIALFELQFANIKVDGHSRVYCTERDGGLRAFILFVVEAFYRKVRPVARDTVGSQCPPLTKAMYGTGHTTIGSKELRNYPDFIKALRKAGWLSADHVRWLREVLDWMAFRQQRRSDEIGRLRAARLHDRKPPEAGGT